MEAQAQNSPPVRIDVLDKDGNAVQYSAEFVKDKIVLGRVLSADLRLDDNRVSRIHALIEVRSGKIIITDLASTHGTYVNGEKIVESQLSFGDTVTLGGVTLRVEKGSGKVVPVAAGAGAGSERTQTSLDTKPNIVAERRERSERRSKETFPKEKRLSERREGERRLDQRKGERRVKTGVAPNDNERRKPDSERRQPREWERRVGERRKGDRRVFDITSLERRIEDRRERKSDDDVLPEELEAAFTQPDHARELEVTALWGDHILDVSNYVDPITLNVGESPSNEYVIPSDGIPFEFPLVSIHEDQTAHLAFTDQMTGTVRARDGIYKLEDLSKEKFVKRSGGHYTVPLRQDDFAKVSIGSVNFFILYVKPAPRVKPAPLFDRDGLLLRTLIGSALLTFLTILGLSFVPEPKPVTIEMIPERFAKIVIKKRPKIPDLVQKNQKPLDKGSKKSEGAKAKKSEGKAKAQQEKPKDKPKSMRAKAKKSTKAVKKKTVPKRKVVDTKSVKKVGLLEAFSKSGLKSNIKQLLDKNTGVDAFDKGLQSSRGSSGGGAAGAGIKGIKVGGGGKTIGIDGPSTKGVGGGASGSGIGEGIDGPGRLGEKGEHSVSVVSENVQVLSGLPKDVINRIVQDNRGLIRRCYETARRRNPSLKGKVTVSFKIDPNGRVTYAAVRESTIGDGVLEKCIVARIRTLRFPKPEAPVETEVGSYPFYLNPVN